MEYTAEQLEIAFEKASPKIKEILSDSWVAETAGRIGQDFNLRIDRIDMLVKIIGLVLLDMIALPNFVKVLESDLDLEQDFAKKMAEVIDREIFEKVREMVKNDGNVTDFKEQEIENTRAAVEQIIEAVESGDVENMSFKDKLNNTKIHKIEQRDFDPYREPIE